MPSGYLVQLGNYSLDVSDTIVDPIVTFTTDTVIGAGNWEWSGTWSGITFTNEAEPGVYYAATDGNVYFVPDYGPVDTLTASTVTSAPSYTTWDGVIDGSDLDDVIDVTFTDNNGDVVDGGTGTGTGGLDDSILAGEGDDTVASGLGNDTVFGGLGADSIDASDGDDVVYGDSELSVSQEFNWSDQGVDGADVFSGFTQNTGEIDVSVSFSDIGNNSAEANIETTDTIYQAPGESFDQNSSLRLFGNGDGSTSTTTLNFAAASGSQVEDEVTNVRFRISDIDWGNANHRDIVTVNAYDADGNAVTVQITPGSNDVVSGNTITAGDLGESQADASGSALITIEGPVEEIEIIYENGLDGTQAVWVSDITFDAVYDGDDDSIDGGAGNDTVFAGGGDDTIIGGLGDDSLVGGSGDDLIFGLTGDDTLEGGTGNDTLFGGADDDLLDGGIHEDELYGGSGADTLLGGRNDDTLSGGAGADSLEGGDGDDTLYVSQGDEAYGENGDDLFVITDTGDTGTIVIVGGEGRETNGDTLDLNGLADRSTLTITNSDDSNGGLSGTVELRDGTLVQFSEIENIVCFTPGTRILTEHGEREIETLRPGDMVMTKDEGLQPIRWIGDRTVPADGRFAPVAVTSALFPEAKRTLLVSPQHRFLVSDWRAELMFGEREVLVSATHMVDDERAFALPRSFVTYIHLMLDRHQIIYAEGVETESFHAGDIGIAGLSDMEREDMMQEFPELRTDLSAYGPTVRRCLKRHEADAILSTNGATYPRSPRRVAAPSVGANLRLI
ncbi:Hint domain-containing protein [Shimia sp.]|uniref:Hint domain-containing protein n=1 Tax=Shimia sp. TaxID=1954381 RepID=UPI003297C234